MKTALFTAAALLSASLLMAQPVPNGGFESWNSRYYAHPDSGWFNSNAQSLASHDSLTVWQVPGFSGQAVHIQTTLIGPDTLRAYVCNKPGNPNSPQGGVPYSQQPSGINGYFRYDILGGDTALIWVRFKKSGTVVSNDVIKITGSASGFVPFTYPLTLSMVPDTVIIEASSSNLLNAGGFGIASGSWLELDQLAFGGSGITQIIPGGSFDNWLPDTIQNPTGWQIAGGNSAGVIRTTDAFGGTYALQLVTQPPGGGPGPGGPRAVAVSTGTFGATGPPSGGLPYINTVDTLEGYYKYTTSGTDSGQVNVSIRKTGTGNVGGGRITLPAAATYTYFQVPLTTTMTPDTIRIDISSSKVGPGSGAITGSTLKVDSLRLRSHAPTLGLTSGIALPVKLTIYPNPADDVLNFSFSELLRGQTSIIIYDNTGKTIINKTYTDLPPSIQLPVGNLAEGLYFYEVRNSGSIIRNRFVKIAQ